MKQKQYGPKTPLAREMHEMKYRQEGEDFRDYGIRVADALSDDADHFKAMKDILLDQRLLPGGRVQAAMGALKHVTAYNCFVSGVIEDSMDSIMDKAKEAAETMRLGGGIGYDFSRIRPRGSRIKSLDSQASGPVSFMRIFDSVCQTIASSGHRRGAQMAVLRVDHPDILQFIRSKRNSDALTGFNISVGVTDEFMAHLKDGREFPLRFAGTVYEWIDPQDLWDEIMRTTWDWAEPKYLGL
jgi:ribonucleoside-diphosphate reductase alpha chain